MENTILAVDDSATVREVLRSTLTEAEYDVVLAEDGQDALGHLMVGPDKVDMILTDLNMPNMTGIELIQKVRQKEGFRFIPILMLTTEKREDLKHEGKQAGASCWLNKPFQPEKLLAVVKMIVPN